LVLGESWFEAWIREKTLIKLSYIEMYLAYGLMLIIEFLHMISNWCKRLTPGVLQ